MEWSTIVSSISSVASAASVVVAVLIYRSSRSALSDAWAREVGGVIVALYPSLRADYLGEGVGTPYANGGNRRLLPLKNGGRGPALNVGGFLTVIGSDGSTLDHRILAGGIAAGELLDAHLDPPLEGMPCDRLDGARALLSYEDVIGVRYEIDCAFAASSDKAPLEVSVGRPREVSRRPVFDR